MLLPLARTGAELAAVRRSQPELADWLECLVVLRGYMATGLLQCKTHRYIGIEEKLQLLLQLN